MPRAIERARASAEAGFTLLEAMVALVVLATLLSVMFRGVVQNRAGASAFALQMREDILARAVLDQVLTRRDLKPNTYRGEFKGRPWIVRVTQADVPLAKADARAAQNAGLPRSQLPQSNPQKPNAGPTWIPYRIDIRIDDGDRRIRLETLHLAKAPPRQGGVP